MKPIVKSFLFGFLALVCAAGCKSRSAEKTAGEPRICAHRGFWKNAEAGKTQNSIASLRLAQENGFWGSEFDVHITADDVVVVNHDKTYGGLPIHSSTYAQLSARPQKNGEQLSTIQAYLDQGAQSPCMLVLELKNQESREKANKMLDICVEALQERGLLDPSRVMFISFDLEACGRIARELPEFTNQYLNGDLSPEELNQLGINGLDYNSVVLRRHPDWVERAHRLGMSTNVWTVDSRAGMKYFIGLGVDCITTNKPLQLRALLENR